jgi:phosphoenolpyruvate carboxykinase (ATP)
VRDVPAGVLDPRSTWPDPAAYDKQAHELAEMFAKNFEKFGDVAQTIRSAGPRV